MTGSIDMTPSYGGSSSIFFESQIRAKQPRFPNDIDLSGQVAIVTGSYAGIGFHCARQLLTLKLSRLIIAIRSVNKGRPAAAELRREFPNAMIDVWALDMTSYESCQSFAAKAEAELQCLDIVILNAGVFKATRSIMPSTGHEESVQVNYLSTFLLAVLFLPLLKARSPPERPGRLTMVGSSVALYAKLEERNERPLLKAMDNPEDGRKWKPDVHYPNTKLLGHLGLVKLKDYVSADDVVVNIVDPALVRGTSLHRGFSGALGAGFAWAKSLAGRTLESGASTLVDAAVVKGKESHGCYVMDWKISPFAAIVYSVEGKELIDVLWDETMAEFEFINPRGILASLRD